MTPRTSNNLGSMVKRNSITMYPLTGLYTNRGPLFLNTLRPRQSGRLSTDDIFKRIFFHENVWISITISPKFVTKGPINNIPAIVQIMAWRRPGDKLLSEPMLVGSLTHICVTWSQWVKWQHILQANLMKSRSREIGWYSTRIARKCDRQISEWLEKLNPNFVASRLQENLR